MKRNYIKQILILLVSLLTIDSFSQSLNIGKTILTDLPRTSDDFQNYQYNYVLENGIKVESSEILYSPISLFEYVGIDPLEHNGNVQSIEYTLCNAKSMVACRGEVLYDYNGKFAGYEGFRSKVEHFQFGFDKWSEVNENPLLFTGCIPNAYLNGTYPTRNSKGLITNIENQLKYSYDELDRVIKVSLNDDEYSYCYDYFSNSKNIKTIKIYEKGRIRADAVYGYYDGKISKLDCNLYNRSGTEGFVEEEFHKKYQYDSHNGVSAINFSKKQYGVEDTYNYTFNNEYDNHGKILSSEISKMHTGFNHANGRQLNGTYKSPKIYHRKYTYDNYGNWIRIQSQEGFIVRKITYHDCGQGENKIYHENEVSVKPSFGQTFLDYLNNNKNILYSAGLEKIKTTVNVDFVVEKDGSVSNIMVYNSSYKKGAISDIATRTIKQLRWTPATINGKPVRCNLSVAWRYDNYQTILLKDIRYSKAEKDAFEKGKDLLGFSSDKESSVAKLFPKLFEAAEQGDAAAQFELGKMYYEGKGVSKDYAEAVKWYKKVAEQGDAVSQFNVGNMYFKGEGVSKDYAEAIKWFQMAEQGCTDAQFMLGVMHSEGFGVSQNSEEAVRWYKKAAEQGNVNAQFNLGNMYNLGKGVPLDYVEAFKWYKKAAEQGDTDAQFNVGVKFFKGEGVSKDYGEAVKWYKKAAEQGKALGQYNLAVMYEKGYGVPQDYGEAVKWFKMAAKQNLSLAIKKLNELNEM